MECLKPSLLLRMECAEGPPPSVIHLHQHVPLVTTVGCPVIDELLKGGLHCSSITELSGRTGFCSGDGNRSYGCTVTLGAMCLVCLSLDL